MLARVIDFLKNKGITAFFTSLTEGGNLEKSEVGVSSLMDTWILVRMYETNGERNRLIYIMKSRGMAHSNQMREFILSKQGIQLLDVYVGPGQVLTGTARLMQESRDRATADKERRESKQRRVELEHGRSALKVEIENLQQKLTDTEDALRFEAVRERTREETIQSDQEDLRSARKSD